MFRYVNKNKALDMKFTNHGSYYGIPLYIRFDNEDLIIVPKLECLWFLIDIVQSIELFIWNNFIFNDSEEIFRFNIGEELEND